MRKLDDIPKKSPFKVPEGYFDQLPNVIQTRMANEGVRSGLAPVWSLSLRLAIPVIALVVAGIFWFRPAPSLDSQLADVDTEQIALFLDNSEHVDDDSQDAADWSKAEMDELEYTIYSNMNDDLLNNIDLENL